MAPMAARHTQKTRRGTQRDTIVHAICPAPSPVCRGGGGPRKGTRVAADTDPICRQGTRVDGRHPLLQHLLNRAKRTKFVHRNCQLLRGSSYQRGRYDEYHTGARHWNSFTQARPPAATSPSLRRSRSPPLGAPSPACPSRARPSRCITLTCLTLHAHDVSAHNCACILYRHACAPARGGRNHEHQYAFVSCFVQDQHATGQRLRSWQPPTFAFTG